MIDTWFTAAVCLGILMLGAVFRAARTRNRADRYLATMVAITIGSAAGMTASIAFGTLLILDVTIILALLCFAGTIAVARHTGGPAA
jgi:multisubunit Na+/H+ antiporter MnhF subunit